MLNINTTAGEHVLSTTINGRSFRFGVGAVPAGESARQVFEGPMVPGPWTVRKLGPGAVKRPLAVITKYNIPEEK